MLEDDDDEEEEDDGNNYSFIHSLEHKTPYTSDH
jgi:hypothetical protein